MNFASPTTNQLGFMRWRPRKVQPSHRPGPFILRDACLNYFDGYTVRRKLISAPGTGKKTPLIFQAFKLDDIGALQFGFSENQATLLNYDDSEAFLYSFWQHNPLKTKSSLPTPLPRGEGSFCPVSQSYG
jgi:hypothetical protein